MKNKYVKNAMFLAFLLPGVFAMNAQDNSKPRQIKFKTSSKISLQEAPTLIRQKLKLSPNDNLLKVKSKVDDLGFTHEKYQQKFKGLKVEFSTYTAHAKNGALKSMSGELYDVKTVNILPKLSKRAAFQRAVSHTGAEEYLWDNPKQAKSLGNYKKPEGELLILPGEVIGKDKARLAYKFDIYATKPLSRGYLYIDAHTGESLFFNAIIKHLGEHAHSSKNLITIEDIISKKVAISNAPLATGNAATRYSGNRSITTRVIGGSYVLRDNTRGNGVNTYNSGGQNSYPTTNFTDADNNWTAAEFDNSAKDNAALDAHWGAEMTYDYFQAKHNRNSYNGSGATINSYVHYGNAYDNAFWNGSVMTYGDGSSNGNEGNGYFDALTSIDVAAHEIGHAVCSSTADLAYQRESGGLNEGFSDIWGAAVEHFAKGNGNDAAPDASVWLIGDEIDRRSGSVALRSMSNPNERSQPDTYGGTYWKEPNCGTPTSSNDYCGVHTNSGVLNYWFYLLTVGGSGTNDINNSFNVTGIGMTKAAKISYRLEVNYLSANSKFEDARNGAISAATDLYGANSSEVIAVTNAWHAVGVGDAFSQPCALAAPSNFGGSSINDNGFTLSWSAVSGAASYEVTVNGATSTVSGTSKVVTGLTSGTAYACEVKAKCSSGGDGAASNTSVTTTGTAPISYCSSKGNSVADEYIQKVAIGSISNTSGAGNGYTDHTSLSTNLEKSTSHTITITPKWTGTIYNEGYAVFIDYNKDGDFEDSGETVWTKSASKDTTVSGSFTVPSGATEGATRMRVILRYNAVPSSCGSYDYGETEDYTVVIGSAQADTQAPSAPSSLVASSISQTALTLNWTASTDNVGVTGYDVYRGSTKISTTTTTTSYNVTGLTANTGYSFSVKAQDAAGNESSSSNVANVTTLPNAVSYCASKGNNSSYEWIDYVSFGGMTNSTGNDGGYADYTSKVATVATGSTNQLIVSTGFRSTAYNEYYSIWIDYNQNGTFESSEKVASGNSTSSGNLSYNVSVPSGANLGTTRMRVSMKWNASQTACESFSYGEVEDYTVSVITSNASVVNTLTSSIKSDILQNEKVLDLMTYPNPVINSVQVKFASKAKNITYEIVNTIGSVVKKGQITSTNLDVSTLTSGIYILKVNDGQKQLKTKLVKK
ncbi:M4 family metallopeptidase [Tenacibaculum sp. nBUS_03]|uniref:M4 family metallopeptidase n=1 Tax=Tenacibaculum sp. nBUS_03 TaxID=3395320 RepID=UPI003EC05E88